MSDKIDMCELFQFARKYSWKYRDKMEIMSHPFSKWDQIKLSLSVFHFYSLANFKVLAQIVYAICMMFHSPAYRLRFKKLTKSNTCNRTGLGQF